MASHAITKMSNALNPRVMLQKLEEKQIRDANRAGIAARAYIEEQWRKQLQQDQLKAQQQAQQLDLYQKIALSMAAKREEKKRELANRRLTKQNP